MESENNMIRIKAILEVLGKPKEHIEEKLKEYIERIKKDENIIVMSHNLSEATEQGEIWSIFADIEVVIKGMVNLFGFCLDYTPSSIEILKPEEFKFKDTDTTTFINDLLGKLHQTNMITKQLGTENRFLKKNMHNLIKNNIMMLIRFGVSDIESISKANGIDKEETKKFLDVLIKEERIKEHEGSYSLNK
jgi:hypothetical protein